MAKFPDLSTPVVMGILNVTPDSFYDGGRYIDAGESLHRIEKMLSDGASIIDIGGASTRPGAGDVGPEEEWSRIVSVLDACRKQFAHACISVDTYHAGVAEKALGHGADMINDISGGTFDEKMPPLIGKWNVPYVIMHIRGMPGYMQADPHYDDVVEEVASWFKKQISIFTEHGASQLILDPGFGFGKTVEHNYTLLNKLEGFSSFGYPVMAGLSRKSMINRVIGTSAEEALNGTTALNTIALMKGAKILRVHDVKEAVEAIMLVERLRS